MLFRKIKRIGERCKEQWWSILTYIFHSVLLANQWHLLILKVRYADLKIYLHVLVHIKIMFWKFRTVNLKNSRAIYPLSYKHAETIKYVKK